MRLSILILSLALPAAAAAAPPAALPKQDGRECPADRARFGDGRPKAETRRLGELPPGALYLSVDRKVDGCRQPVIVRYGIGGGSGSRPGR